MALLKSLLLESLRQQSSIKAARVRLFILASVTAVMVPLAGHTQQTEVPSGTQIRSVVAYGSGCREGSATSSISPDSRELSLLFDDFLVQSGGNSGRVSDKKNCVVEVRLGIPSGWSMTLMTADYRGFVALDPGAMAQHEVLYSFNKAFTGSSFSTTNFVGPRTENYFVRNTLRIDQYNWSTCNQSDVTLTVRLGLVTQPQTGVRSNPNGQLTLDSVDTSTRQTFGIGWQRCGNGGGGVTPPNRPPRPRPGPISPPGGGIGQPGAGEIDIFQFSNGSTLYYTQDARLAEQGTWINQGVAFRIMRSPSPTMNQALYSCWFAGNQRAFLSLDSLCEGQRTERLLGYVGSRATAANQAELLRLMDPTDSTRRAATTRRDDFPGFSVERSLGVVIRTR